MKARIVAVTVQAQIFIDDGDYLMPHPVESMMILWRDWPQFSAHGLQDALEKLQQQLDAQAAQTTAPGD